MSLFPHNTPWIHTNRVQHVIPANLGLEFPAFWMGPKLHTVTDRQAQVSELTIVDNQILHDYISKQ